MAGKLVSKVSSSSMPLNSKAFARRSTLVFAFPAPDGDTGFPSALVDKYDGSGSDRTTSEGYGKSLPEFTVLSSLFENLYRLKQSLETQYS